LLSALRDGSGSTEIDCCGVFGLVEANLAAAGKADGGFGAPRLFLDNRAPDFLGLERFDQRWQVVAHQVEHGTEEVTASVRLLGVSVRGMNAGFGGRKREDQPTLAGIDGAKSEDVAKEGAICLRLVAVKENVSACNTSKHGGKSIRGASRWQGWAV
jgi:hypothetical protein